MMKSACLYIASLGLCNSLLTMFFIHQLSLDASMGEYACSEKPGGLSYAFCRQHLGDNK